MPDWLTYRLSDLLLFSPRTYFRTFELYHLRVWPAQLMAIALALSMVILLRGDADRRALRGRLIAGLLAACWLWVGIAFHLRSYATINWAARYFGYLFIAQAALFLWGGVVRARLTFAWPTRAAGRVALGLFVSALVLYPLATLAAGRSWQQVELFGLTSDATAVGTLGLLGLASPRFPTPFGRPACYVHRWRPDLVRLGVTGSLDSIHRGAGRDRLQVDAPTTLSFLIRPIELIGTDTRTTIVADLPILADWLVRRSAVIEPSEFSPIRTTTSVDACHAS